MKFMWWRKEGTARIHAAKKALVETDLELLQAKQQRAVSEDRRLSLAEIRRDNHFTQSIFPKGVNPS